MTERMEHSREISLVCAAQKEDRIAAEELLQAHFPLIVMLAGRFHTSSYLKEELIQAGCMGFVKALSKYRYEQQVRLMTYAVPWILGEMKAVLRDLESQKLHVSYDDLAELQCEAAFSDAMPEELGAVRLDLKLAFEKLSDEERLLLYLRYFRDRTQRETALLLRKSQSQISKTEKRLLDWLRDQLS